MRDHYTPTRQTYLQRIQSRVTIRDVLTVAICGTIIGSMLGLAI